MQQTAANAHAHERIATPAPNGAVSDAHAIDLRLDWIGAPGRSSCTLETVWRDPSLTRGIAGVYLIWSNLGGTPVIL